MFQTPAQTFDDSFKGKVHFFDTSAVCSVHGIDLTSSMNRSGKEYKTPCMNRSMNINVQRFCSNEKIEMTHRRG